MYEEPSALPLSANAVLTRLFSSSAASRAGPSDRSVPIYVGGVLEFLLMFLLTASARICLAASDNQLEEEYIQKVMRL
jgi:hypothetical protein